MQNFREHQSVHLRQDALSPHELGLGLFKSHEIPSSPLKMGPTPCQARLVSVTGVYREHCLDVHFPNTDVRNIWHQTSKSDWVVSASCGRAMRTYLKCLFPVSGTTFVQSRSN
ncbi:hypothetical protein DPEC_G00287340 [Dallia pectoralis]|uniref:Uncharacterized protein n=1 Tax=Dallia pectoralis TaxID=75939 RepID=A0ACC2FKD2_DALPE|nr:hypothetical protein DPEC_G00287340 [Dallia pectoralis]